VYSRFLIDGAAKQGIKAVMQPQKQMRPAKNDKISAPWATWAENTLDNTLLHLKRRRAHATRDVNQKEALSKKRRQPTRGARQKEASTTRDASQQETLGKKRRQPKRGANQKEAPTKKRRQLQGTSKTHQSFLAAVQIRCLA